MATQSPFQTSTQRTGEAVAYFRHFPKANEDLSAQTAFGRLHSWNCEWLNRPHTVISEYADTIMSYVEIVCQYENDVFSPQFVRRTFSTYQPIFESLQRLNHQNKASVEEATRQDITRVLRFLEGTEDTDDFFQTPYHAGGAMYLMGIHSLVPGFLLWNPAEYADRVKETKETMAFRNKKTATAMRLPAGGYHQTNYKKTTP